MSSDPSDPLHLCGKEIKGRYRVKQLLGAGGMGVVYEALHLQLGQPCALKLILPEIAQRDTLLLRRFRREARIGSRIRHEGLVQVFDFDELDDGTPFYSMELLSGRPLGALLAEQPLDWPEALEVALQAAAALGALHRSNIYHRDVKPPNMQVLRDGRVKVLDLGVIRASLDVDDGELTDVRTVTGLAIGTPQYMAPEQLLDSTRVDQRTDIYALAVVIFEMITGRHLFRNASVEEMALQKCQYKQPLNLRQHCPKAPEPLEALLRRCIQEPHQRPANTKDLSAALERLLPVGREQLCRRLAERNRHQPNALQSLWDTPSGIEVPLSSLVSLTRNPEVIRYKRRVVRGRIRQWGFRGALVATGGLAAMLTWVYVRPMGRDQQVQAATRPEVPISAQAAQVSPAGAAPAVAPPPPAPASRQQQRRAGPSTAPVRIQVNAHADIYIDGVRRAEGAPHTYALPPGRHQIRAVNTVLGQDELRVVRVSPGRGAVVDIRWSGLP